MIFLGLIEFYWDLPSFTGFHWVLLGFVGVLLGFTGFWYVFKRFYWVLLFFKGFYWVLLGFLGCYRVLPSFFFWLPGFCSFIFSCLRPPLMSAGRLGCGTCRCRAGPTMKKILERYPPRWSKDTRANFLVFIIIDLLVSQLDVQLASKQLEKKNKPFSFFLSIYEKSIQLSEITVRSLTKKSQKKITLPTKEPRQSGSWAGPLASSMLFSLTVTLLHPPPRRRLRFFFFFESYFRSVASLLSQRSDRPMGQGEGEGGPIRWESPG